MIFVKEIEELLTPVCSKLFELKKKEEDYEQLAFFSIFWQSLLLYILRSLRVL